MVNILSEHLAVYYGWTEDEKLSKIVFLSTLIGAGNLLGAWM